MQFKLDNLKDLIKEVLTEDSTYFGASTAGSLANPAFHKGGPYKNQARDVENPIDEVELKEKVLEILLSIPDIPQNTENDYSDTMVSVEDIAVVIRAHVGQDAGHPLGNFGDVAYNHASSEAANVLIDDPKDLEGAAKSFARGLLYPDEEYDRATTRMYESKLLLAYPGASYED